MLAQFNGDVAMLDQAIAELDPVVALLSLVQITGDRTLLHKFGPALEGTQHKLREAFVSFGDQDGQGAASSDFLVHWGARLFSDMADLKRTYEHTDDITADTAIGMLIDNMKKRGIAFEVPTDPLHDNAFVGIVAQAYDIGGPTNIPADAMDEVA
ncbi:hypothetical protein [Novosphingobium sp.]|uniref:hypothetical protein n=1 Tax=Novosphingobium sp. TaxID=1874826 RepID=UPI003D0D284A